MNDWRASSYKRFKGIHTIIALCVVKQMKERKKLKTGCRIKVVSVTAESISVFVLLKHWLTMIQCPLALMSLSS